MMSFDRGSNQGAPQRTSCSWIRSNARTRLAGDLQGSLDEISLLEEELRIKDARMATIDAHRRPHYRPIERMAILEIKAARGWSQAETARRFLVKPTTVASWLKRIDESSQSPLVQIREPVNKFPIHRYGSIAVIERFVKSLKDEWLRRLIIPLRLEAMRAELSIYMSWFNEHRPHQFLNGRTPMEIYKNLVPANEATCFEPRANWPTRQSGAPGARTALVVSYYEGRRQLPIFELRQAA